MYGTFQVVCVNRIANRCSATGAQVPVGAGFSTMRMEGNRKVWNTWCADLGALPRNVVEAIEIFAGKQAARDERADQRGYLNADGVLTAQYDAQKVAVIKTLPGRRWDAARKVNILDVTVSRICETVDVCKSLGYDIAPELVERADAARAKRADNFPSLDGFLNVKGQALRPFQVEGVRWMRERSDSLILGDDMGLGKTAQVLMALPVGGRTVIVAPNAVKYNWIAEARTWRPDLKISIFEGNGSFRWPEENEIVITGFAILPKIAINKETNWQVKGFDEASNDLLIHVPSFDLVVDEVHRAKNPKAQRGQRVKALSHLAAKTYGLTGTPLANRPPDLWGTLQACNLAYESFGSWDAFVRSFNGSKNRFGYEWGNPTEHVIPALKRVMLRRRKDEVLRDLPPKTYTDIAVEIRDNLLVADLDDLEREYQMLLSDEGSELPPFERFSGIRARLAKSRAQDAIDMIEDYRESGTPIVVFSAHKDALEIVHEAVGDTFAVITGETAAHKRAEIVERFQAGQLEGLLCTIQAAGVGLTMTRASTILFIDLSWVPADNWQAEDRICRIGQTAKSCNIVRLHSAHALDEHVQSLLIWKAGLIDKSINAASVGVGGAVNYASLREQARSTLKVDAVGVVESKGASAMRSVAEQAAAERAKTARRADTSPAVLRARGKINAHQRELINRYENDLPVVTPALKMELIMALSVLAARCDGARTKDDVGFNKPDAAAGHWFVDAGAMAYESDADFYAALGLVYKYKRQLGGKASYPNIYAGDSDECEDL